MVLRPEDFADTFDKRPTVPVEIGLRCPSEAAIQTATIEAEKLAAEAPEAERNRTHNGHLMTFVVARGMCNVHDVTQPHPVFELAEDIIPVAFKPATIKNIFDRIEMMVVGGTMFPEASAEELHELGEYLAMDDPFDGLDPLQRSQCARYARLILSTIRDPGE